VSRKPSLYACCLFLVAALFFLSACTPVIPQPEASQSQEPFRPPTPVSAFASTAEGEGSSTPEAGADSSSAESPNPTVTVPCSNNLAFLKDVTIPDGTVVAPEATLDKRWEVHNSGNCNWGESYRVRLIAGSELGAQREQALFPARSDSRVILRIVFKAPLEPGTYRSAWQAFNPQGEPFGDPFFIEVTVQ
jgi:hypothetical protein